MGGIIEGGGAQSCNGHIREQRMAHLVTLQPVLDGHRLEASRHDCLEARLLVDAWPQHKPAAAADAAVNHGGAMLPTADFQSPCQSVVADQAAVQDCLSTWLAGLLGWCAVPAASA